MTGATLCSGIRAPECGMPWVDWKWAADIEAFPNAVGAHRYPGVPNLGDITAPDFTDRAKALGPLGVLVAGTPCQAFSVAGLRKSLEDARGNLTLRFVEIVNELNPGIVVWENVPGVLNTSDNAFGCFLGALVGADTAIVPPAECGGRWTRAGVVDGPARLVAWRVLDAQYFGVAQRRERVFVVACPRGGRLHPAEILFEREGVQRYFAPSREAGEAVAGDARESAACGSEPVAHALTANGFDASEDGTGRGTPLVPVFEDGPVPTLTSNSDAHSGYRDEHGLVPVQAFYSTESRCDNIPPENLSPPLKIGSNGGGQPPAVCFNLRGRDEGSQPEVSDVASLRAASGGSSRSYLCFDTTQITSKANFSNPKPGAACHPLAAGAHPPAVATGWAVRRLTPTECERLQGFPDGHTAIEYRGKAAADGPRYKALGNSMAVPVLKWIGDRIREVAHA